jgi:ribosomal protein L32
MSQKTNPTQLNLQSLAASSGSFEGQLDRASDGDELDKQFARLAAEACVPGGLEQVVWRGQAKLRDEIDANPQVWLHLDVSASLPMICQRCMTPTMVQLRSQQWFRFVPQERIMAVQQNKKSPSKRGMHRSHNALSRARHRRGAHHRRNAPASPHQPHRFLPWPQGAEDQKRGLILFVSSQGPHGSCGPLFCAHRIDVAPFQMGNS